MENVEVWQTHSHGRPHNCGVQSADETMFSHLTRSHNTHHMCHYDRLIRNCGIAEHCLTTETHLISPSEPLFLWPVCAHLTYPTQGRRVPPQPGKIRDARPQLRRTVIMLIQTGERVLPM